MTPFFRIFLILLLLTGCSRDTKLIGFNKLYTFGGPGVDRVCSLMETQDGYLLVSLMEGELESISHTSSENHLVCTLLDDNLELDRHFSLNPLESLFDGTISYSSFPEPIACMDIDNNFIISGNAKIKYDNPEKVSRISYCAKYDKNYKQVFCITYNFDEITPIEIICDDDNNIYLLYIHSEFIDQGKFASSLLESTYHIDKIDPEGNFAWQLDLSKDRTRYYDMVYHDDHLYLCGLVHKDWDLFVTKLDKYGDYSTTILETDLPLMKSALSVIRNNEIIICGRGKGIYVGLYDMDGNNIWKKEIAEEDYHIDFNDLGVYENKTYLVGHTTLKSQPLYPQNPFSSLIYEIEATGYSTEYKINSLTASLGAKKILFSEKYMIVCGEHVQDSINIFIGKIDMGKLQSSSAGAD